jgi:hypothetical protein
MTVIGVRNAKSRFLNIGEMSRSRVLMQPVLYWRMDNNLDVGLLIGYVLYWLPIELGSMDLDTFSR